MTAEAHARKVPRWVIPVAIVLSTLAVTRMLVQQKAQRRALRDAALVSANAGTERERDAHATIAPDGRVVVGWTGLPAGATAGDRIGLRALVKGSHAWGDPASLLAPEPLHAGPVLASTDDGATWLAFAGKRVYATRAPAGTLEFAPPFEAAGTDEGIVAAAPWLAATGSTAWLVAREDLGGDRARARLVVRALRDGDGGSAPRVIVSEADGLAGALPTICVAGPHVYIAWIDPSRGVVLSAGDATDGGPHFAREREVVVSSPNEAVALEAPQCLAHEGEVTVLYGLAAAALDPGSSTPLEAAVLARSVDGGRTFGARTRVGEPGLALMHPAMAREASGTIALVYYAARTDPDAFAAFRWRRVPVVGGPADAARDARAPMRLSPRRSDPKWAGEHVGAVAGSGVLGAAFVDNLEGTRVAFVELGP